MDDQRAEVRRHTGDTFIVLPLTNEAAKAVVIAADAFGVEPWEMAVHVLQARRWFDV